MDEIYSFWLYEQLKVTLFAYIHIDAFFNSSFTLHDSIIYIFQFVPG